MEINTTCRVVILNCSHGIQPPSSWEMCTGLSSYIYIYIYRINLSKTIAQFNLFIQLLNFLVLQPHLLYMYIYIYIFLNYSKIESGHQYPSASKEPQKGKIWNKKRRMLSCSQNSEPSSSSLYIMSPKSKINKKQKQKNKPTNKQTE